MLKLTLFGSPQLALDEQSLSNEINGKTLALLVYLAVSEQAHTRDILADLLWSEMPTSLARKNLRNTLYDLRVLVGSHLVITRGDILFNGKSAYWLDVDVFRHHVTPSQLQANPAVFQEVLNLYRGDFLAGFHVRNAPVFEEWMVGQRELLRSLVLQGLDWLTAYALQVGDEEMGLAATSRLLALEPTVETTHRQRMWLLVRSGQQSAALAQYVLCQQVLAAELNTTPAPETIELYEKIKSGAVRKADGVATYWPVDQSLPSGAPRTPPTSSPQQAWTFPPQMVPVLPLEITVRPPLDWETIPQVHQFYGREHELICLTQWLAGERCHLIGVFGLGGQGKTTLVARLVEQLRGSERPSRDGSTASRISIARRETPGRDAPIFQRIIWLPLVDHPEPGEIILTWLQRLSNQPATALPTQSDQQFALLFDYLKTQRCLCVLDNVEQMMEGGAQIDGYKALLRQFALRTHQSCLLLISRERPQEFTALEEENVLVRSLWLEGLALEASRTLLQARGVASLDVATSLHQRYAGHPLALTLVAETIGELFHGDGTPFLMQGPFVFEKLRKILDQQFVRLDSLAQEILAWLALEDRTLSVSAVWDCLRQPQSYTRFLEALRVLLRCSLVENSQSGFALPAVMREYVRQGLLETLQLELQATALAYVKFNTPMVDSAQTGTHFHTVTQRLRAQLGQANLWARLQSKAASLAHRPFAAPLPPHNLPRSLTSFVGRSRELLDLQAKVLAFDYPLLTVVGKAGAGKTRLALELAERVLTHFPDGVWFVPLAGMTPSATLPNQLVAAIGHAMQLNFVEHIDWTNQLFAYLRHKKVLLVLDRFEDIGGGASFLCDLLQATRSVKLLITARQRLYVQSEFVFRLSGLAFPDGKAPQLDAYGSGDKPVESAFQAQHAPQDAHLLYYASVQLFIERARQSAPDFVLTEANLAAISRISQCVEGLPLAIELAAALVDEYTCTDIVRLLEQNLIHLSAALRDMPAHERNPRALMAYSWQLLPGD